MSKLLKLDKNTDEGVRYLLNDLLETGKVSAVFSLRKLNENGAVSYSLIADPGELDNALPLYPLMPGNAGNLLSQFTLDKALHEPVAVVIRPCELRAFIELVKRKKANLENLFIISPTCSGVYPLDSAVNGDLDKNLSGYRKAVKEATLPENVRRTCKACENFIPGNNADIIISSIGADIDTECRLVLNTDSGEKLVEGLEGAVEEDAGELESEKLMHLKSLRNEEKMRLFDEIGSNYSGLDGLVKVFGKCIGCKGCRAVCPICYCQLCNFDSQNSKYKLNQNELQRKKGIRIPPNTVYFHLLRLSHMSISCVGCGSCEDVCPADIPISSIFMKVGESVATQFDYLPGRDVEEEIPIKTFELDELAEIER